MKITTNFCGHLQQMKLADGYKKYGTGLLSKGENRETEVKMEG